MGSPAALASLGTSSTVAGGAIGAVGSIFGGMSKQGMYDYQASVAKLNAQIALQNSDLALQQGEQSAQKYGLQAGQRQGQIIAAQSSSGLDVNSGSSKQVQKSQQTITGMDLNQIRSNAAKTAYDFRVTAATDEAQAGAYKAAGNNEMLAGVIGGVSSVLGTAGSVASKWSQAQQVGLYNSGSSSDYTGNDPLTQWSLGR